MNKNKYKKYCYDKDIKVTFDEDGYIIYAKGFNFILWSENPDTLDISLVGKHITELLNILEKYKGYPDVYDSFVKNVLPDFGIEKGKEPVQKTKILKNKSKETVLIKKL